ncbi:MAG: hypothetical protein WBA13_09750 [Microcoleaceae cyanobacterium]
MLRCSQLGNSDCKDVAYFQSRDLFWSPKYGDLPGQVKPQNQNLAKVKPATKTNTPVSGTVSRSPKLRKSL